MSKASYRVRVDLDGTTLTGPWLLGYKGAYEVPQRVAEAMPPEATVTVERKTTHQEEDGEGDAL